MSQDNSFFSSQFTPGQDICQELFDAVLKDDQFIRWQRDRTEWHLRIFGGPGTGKTTVAALIASELRNKHSTDNSSVACIFADEAPGTNWGDIHLEAVLLCILCEFSHQHDQGVGSCTELDPKIGFCHADVPGEPGARRIGELLDALSSCLLQLESAFLVLDGVDQCGWFTASCLEDIILELHKKHPHLRVLLTSRTLPIRRDEYGTCENTSHQPDPKMNFLSEPRGRQRYQSVYPAHWSTAKTCDLCRQPLIQPFLFHGIDMSKVLSVVALEDYTRRILQLEHGEVGNEKSTPPLSRHRRLLNSSESQREAHNIAQKADYIISLCRLELDTMCGPWFASDTPVDVHEDTEAFFNELLKSIQSLPPPHSDIALCALAFVCICEKLDIDSTPGRLINTLSRYSREIKTGDQGQPSSFDEADCALDKILFASRGLLLLGKPGGPESEEEAVLLPYSSSFRFFISCGYSPLVNNKVNELVQHMK